MKYISTLALVFIVSIHLFGQSKLEDYEFEFGPYFKVSKRAVPIDFVSADDDAFYMLYGKGKTGTGSKYIHKFDYNFNLLSELKLINSSSGAPLPFKKLFTLEDRLYQVTQGTKKSTEPSTKTYSSSSSAMVKTLNIQEIDKKSMKLLEPREIATLPYNVSSYNSIYMAYSPDTTNLGIIYSLPEEEDMTKLGFLRFDRELNQIDGNILELPYPEDLNTIKSICLANDGFFYILIKKYFGKKKDKIAGKVNYSYVLVQANADGIQGTLDLEAEGKYLTDMHVEVNNQGDIVCGGFYSDKNTLYAGGVFYMHLNTISKEIVAQSFFEFDQDFITQNMTEFQKEKVDRKMKKGKDIELPFYDIDEFILDEKGNTYMVAEMRHIYTTYVYSAYGGYYMNHYNFGDIMVIKINQEDQIEWASKIGKLQHTINDAAMFSSYAFVKRNQELFFLYNDNAENLDYDGTGRIRPMGKNNETVVMISNVDELGNIKRTGLFTRGQAEVKIRPILCHQVNENEMLLFGHKGIKTQRFILLRFK